MPRLQRCGFTLVETIVSIVVLSVVASIVMYIFTEGFRIYVVNKNYIKLRADGRYALSRIAYEIRQAEEIIPDAGNNQKMSIRSDVDNDGHAELIIYERTGELLIRGQEVPSGGWRAWPLCHNMVDSTFTDRDKTCITVKFTLKSGSEEIKLWTDVTTRSGTKI